MSGGPLGRYHEYVRRQAAVPDIFDTRRQQAEVDALLAARAGRTLARPSAGANAVMIEKGTYIDASDDVDHSQSGRLYCHIQDTGGVDQRAYLKFDPIAFPDDGILYILGFYDNYIKAGVDSFFLDPSIAGLLSSVQFYALAYGVEDWVGLDESTLRWTTRNSLVYTSQIGVQLCQLNFTNGTDPGGGGTDGHMAYNAPIPAMILTGTPGQSIEGLLIQGSLGWQNIYYSGGFIFGYMDFVNPGYTGGVIFPKMRILSGLALQ